MSRCRSKRDKIIYNFRMYQRYSYCKIAKIVGMTDRGVSMAYRRILKARNESDNYSANFRSDADYIKNCEQRIGRDLIKIKFDGQTRYLKKSLTNK
jgi:hypothetical protein